LGVRFVSHSPLPYLVGIQSAADYEKPELGWYAQALELVNSLPAGSRIVFLWEPRAYGCAAAVRCVPDVVIDRWWHARRLGAGADEMVNEWRAEGTTHALIYDAGARYIETAPKNGYEASDWEVLAKLRGALRHIATFGDGYSLYAIP
jgi:hypothetical protein